ncbi:MAG: tetratricopeptide repeat protein [Pseudomonadales bacterium]|nr:tetratricopeptide repeat protein [Pseudomonadales bacterium]
MLLGSGLSFQVYACPDLSPFYPQDEVDWSELGRSLSALMPQCLQNSEYFALLGAAQLNAGDIANALEALERSLLLAPDNGGAQVDYAEALFLQGQLFPAMDLNQQLLQREDIPAALLPMLQQRQDSWQALTRRRSLQLDVLTGYDHNLNGAPDRDQIALTLSGESVLLVLSEEFQPVGGAFLNMRLAGSYSQLGPEHQHNALVEVRSRVSEDSDSDLLQMNGHYALVLPGRPHNWQLNAGINNLFFGGSPLFTATEVSGRYTFADSRQCNPFASAAMQHQVFHDQNELNAVESKFGGGVNCPVSGRRNHNLSLELSYINNNPVNQGRAGGRRDGWQFRADWWMQLGSGTLSSQINHTELDDVSGFSPLLSGGDKRELRRSFVLVQYRRPLSRQTSLLLNFFHQDQHSNIDLFRTTDTSVEIGVSLSF